jgi:phospholipase C
VTNRLAAIQHIVVLMLENRSFDHMLGFLYANEQNRSPSGQPFDGLTGNESNPDGKGQAVKVYAIQPNTGNLYFQPGADPGEGYSATNSQLFGTTRAPTPATATNQGFVNDYAYALGWESKEPSWSVLPGTVPTDIMGMYTPSLLPILSGLARGYAVCDQWFSSAPTETLPNRAFVCAATSQGHMDDHTKKYTCPTIFGLLSQRNQSWAIYGYDQQPLTRLDFPDTTQASDDHFGLFTDFQAAAKNGTLPAYTFLEPSWDSAGNSQHPNYDVALGEQFIHDVYYALRSNEAKWQQTLLVITYDEHGGCYDHVPPPLGAEPPDNSVGEYGFDFKRFGVRVPTLLISPLIEPGTVFRVPADSTPLDHTSILKTVETRWGLPALSARDAAAPDFGDVLTLAAPRTDDPLAGVSVPQSSGANPVATLPSHLQQVHAELVSQLPVPDAKGGTYHQMPALNTNAEYAAYIASRTAAWLVSRKQNTQ